MHWITFPEAPAERVQPQSIYKAAAQVRVFLDDFFHLRGLVALGQDRVKVVLDGRRLPDSVEPFSLRKRILAYQLPETGLLEKPGDQLALVLLQARHDIGRNAHLKSVKRGPCSDVVERVGDQVFAATRRSR